MLLTCSHINVQVADFELWRRATDAVESEFAVLPGDFLDKIAILVAEMKSLKRSLFKLTMILDGESICKACNGGCCDSGKYHFTVTDLLSYLSDGKRLFLPDFSNGRCPYLGRAGCMMEPEYRPFNCITFNCERLETLLPLLEVSKFYGMERELHTRYSAMEKLFDNIFAYGLISNYERNSSKKGGILFSQE